MIFHDNCYICLEKTNIYFINTSCNCKIYCHEQCFNNLFYFNKCIICKKNIYKKNFILSIKFFIYLYFKIINFFIDFSIIHFYSNFEIIFNSFFYFIISLILFSIFTFIILPYKYFFSEYNKFLKFNI